MTAETGYLIVLGTVWAGLCLGFISAVGLFIYRSAALRDAQARHPSALADSSGDTWCARPPTQAVPDGAQPTPPAARHYPVFAEPPVVPPIRPKEAATKAEGLATERSAAKSPEEPAAGPAAS